MATSLGILTLVPNQQVQLAICFTVEASINFGFAGIIAWQHIRSSTLANPSFVISR